MRRLDMETLLTIAASVVLSALPADRDTIAASFVASSMKSGVSSEEIATPVTSLKMRQIENMGLSAPKNLSSIVPGLLMPDYGSSMTSTIYVRGIGSRMENPVMGLYIDDVPVLDKNNYDFSFLDVRSVDVHRGPQGTLYGRNSMLGVLAVETLSPSVYQGFRGGVEYGSANSVNVRASAYSGHFGVASMYRHCDGFYTNDYSGDKCDRQNAGAFRFRFSRTVGRVDLDNSLYVSYTREGGYPYRLWVDAEDIDGTMPYMGGSLYPINYNDASGYRRLSLMDGFRVNARLDRWNLRSVTSLQMLFDSMDMDQDFTDKSMFTLNQTQKQYAVTQEFILRKNEHPDWWDAQTGAFVFARKNGLGAPVTFLKDGISSLIIDNANAHIPSDFGTLELKEDNFVIDSDFDIWSYNVAAYHESYFRLGRWLLTAGLRIDHEGDFMRYDSGADINFKVSAMSDYTDFPTRYNGNESNFFRQFLPKASAMFDATSARMRMRGEMLKVVASVSRGYKSGGFNSQIFSDILQNRMMNGMMNKLGVHLDSENALSASATSYKPESCTDCEVGLRYGFDLRGHKLNLSGTAYAVICRNQQITVFPYGNGTGRMMRNAGRSRSLGLELEASYAWKGLFANASASVMDARFVEYDDGREDYSGNRIPYSPSSTLYGRIGYAFDLDGNVLHRLTISSDVRRTGKIMWDETGDLSQSPYALIGADITASFGKFDVFFRGENLTDTDYAVFYFKSVGNSFFQMGRPRRFKVGVSFNL